MGLQLQSLSVGSGGLRR